MLHSGKLALMIVEDDANIRMLLENAATRSGLFEPIATACDGQMAWEALTAAEASSLPALIVTDLSMPRMTGLELVRAVKSDERMRGIPVAIVTSSDVPNDRELALSAGAFAFVAKPFGLEALTRTLVAIRESCGETVAASR